MWVLFFLTVSFHLCFKQHRRHLTLGQWRADWLLVVVVVVVLDPDDAGRVITNEWTTCQSMGCNVYTSRLICSKSAWTWNGLELKANRAPLFSFGSGPEVFKLRATILREVEDIGARSCSGPLIWALLNTVARSSRRQLRYFNTIAAICVNIRLLLEVTTQIWTLRRDAYILVFSVTCTFCGRSPIDQIAESGIWW